MTKTAGNGGPRDECSLPVDAGQFNDRFKRISGIAAHSNLQNAINERALIDLTG